MKSSCSRQNEYHGAVPLDSATLGLIAARERAAGSSVAESTLKTFSRPLEMISAIVPAAAASAERMPVKVAFPTKKVGRPASANSFNLLAASLLICVAFEKIKAWYAGPCEARILSWTEAFCRFSGPR